MLTSGAYRKHIENQCFDYVFPGKLIEPCEIVQLNINISIVQQLVQHESYQFNNEKIILFRAHRELRIWACKRIEVRPDAGRIVSE